MLSALLLYAVSVAAAAALDDALLALLSSEQKSSLLRRLAEGAIAHVALASAASELAGVPPSGRRLEDIKPAMRVENATSRDPLRAVLLFRKSETDTGQLELVDEGLSVLRAQSEPFAIVSAVGPTRTGKSSILGRAFLRGVGENIFRIGSGVTSHTA
eukprot:5579934-Prymnesium_polylepis.1